VLPCSNGRRCTVAPATHTEARRLLRPSENFLVSWVSFVSRVSFGVVRLGDAHPGESKCVETMDIIHRKPFLTEKELAARRELGAPPGLGGLGRAKRRGALESIENRPKVKALFPIRVKGPWQRLAVPFWRQRRRYTVAKQGRLVRLICFKSRGVKDQFLAALLNSLLKNVPEPCHSERSEESRSEDNGLARFLVAFGSSE